MVSLVVNPVIGDWVIVKFETKKSAQEFIGFIIGILDEEEYTVKFATKSFGGLFYVFSKKDDIADMKAAQIVRELPQPSCNSRCQYIFWFKLWFSTNFAVVSNFGSVIKNI